MENRNVVKVAGVSFVAGIACGWVLNRYARKVCCPLLALRFMLVIEGE